MKILSFDIEEWFIERVFRGNEQWKLDAYDAMLDRVLDLLDGHGVKATFFCVGELATMFPQVVRKISAAGHEIGCHSLRHTWLTAMDPDTLREDTHAAVSALEDCCGTKVESYRAPAFSIGEKNKFALDIIAECGIRNDASIFTGVRDFGGFPSFSGAEGPSVVETDGHAILEFPITMGTIPVLNKKIAYSGGGYFRLLPMSFVRGQMESSDYVMCYFHLADLVDFKSKMMNAADYEKYFRQPGTFKNRIVRYLKSNIGRKRSFKGLTELVENYRFINVRDAAKESARFPKIKI